MTLRDNLGRAANRYVTYVIVSDIVVAIVTIGFLGWLWHAVRIMVAPFVRF